MADEISTSALVDWLRLEASGKRPAGDRSFWLQAAARRLEQSARDDMLQDRKAANLGGYPF